MIKTLTVLFVLLSVAKFIYGKETQQQLFNKGNQLLLNGNYSQAIISFELLYKHGLKTSSLYCDLGNAYYKTGNIGKAVLYYEKGLLLSPLDPQLINNRNLINTRLNIPADNSFFSKDNIFLIKTINAIVWACTISLLIASLLYSTLVFKLITRFKKAISKFSKWLMAVTIPLLLLSLSIMIYLQHITNGIIIEKLTARNAPGSLAIKTFELKEGEKTVVVNYFEGWYKVKRYNGQQGWVPASYFSVIKP
jgi:tetratricopeptide (TPR) repeat protein